MKFRSKKERTAARQEREQIVRNADVINAEITRLKSTVEVIASFYGLTGGYLRWEYTVAPERKKELAHVLKVIREIEERHIELVDMWWELTFKANKI